jgi:hypothetical protein
MPRLARSVTSILAAGLLFGACQAGQSPSEPQGHVPKLLTGLGKIHHPISTQSKDAQSYFDQGLALCYGFNHEGAIDAFREAARQDPKCAMCWWGIAFAWGPNINAPMGPEAGAEAWKAAQQARRLSKHASPAEVEYIDAIQVRYSPDAAATAGAGGAPNRRAFDEDFAIAMGKIAQAHPDDADAQALYAESLMDLSPWNYWHDDGSPREFTPDAAQAIEAALALNPDHTGALHYKIHLYERFEPSKAEAAADRLKTQAPAAGHLVHMPAHIYYRVGRYKDSADINQIAAAADVAYFSWCRAPMAYAALYYTHNLHFLWASEMIEGNSDGAMIAARRIVAQIPLDQLGAFPFLEDYLVTPYYTQARFGKWDQILGEPKPPAEQRFVTAIWHYARALAFTRTRKPAEAKAEYAAFVAIADDEELGALVYDTSNGTAGQRLGIAKHHLAGEMAAASGDRKTAVAEFQQAIAIQDEMPYSEPPPFYMPVRQALGAVLLKSGRPREAEAVYLADLRIYPKNGWSLYGLSKSYAAQGKAAQASATRNGFQHAWARADVQLQASRF